MSDTSLRTQLQQEAQSVLAAIIESSDDAIVSKSLTGIIQTWNSGAQRIFGYTASEVVGRPINVLVGSPGTELEFAL